MEKHIGLLGLKVEDKVTKVRGIVTCISFDLYGCIQAIVTQSKHKLESNWFDVSRLTVLDKKPVMQLPNYKRGYVAEGRQGASYKPNGRV